MTVLEDPFRPLAADEAPTWIDVCEFEDLIPERGACALVAGRAVAVFRCEPDGVLYAIDNLDPFSSASVLSRGIVGSIGDRAVVASPVYKQRFDLRTGECVDDPAVRLPVYAVVVHEGRVLVASSPLPAHTPGS